MDGHQDLVGGVGIAQHLSSLGWIAAFTIIFFTTARRNEGKHQAFVALRSAEEGMPDKISSWALVKEPVKWCVGMSAVLAYAWICDRSGLIASRNKTSEPLIGYIALAVIAIGSAMSFKHDSSGKSGFLCNSQTDEWKGWMQLFLVYYHYLYPSPQPLGVYVTARIVVASFLFMTGYGRTMSAMKKSSSFSSFVFASMMIRLNLFVILLSIVMGRTFCDYYFSPLVTFWSIFFYSLHTLGRRIEPHWRILIAAVCCFLLSVNSQRDPNKFSFARIIFSPLRPVLSSSATSFDQWLFRSQLDCFSPLLGAVVALQQHRIREALQWLDAQKKSLYVIGVSLATLCIFLVWLFSLISIGDDAKTQADVCFADCQSCKKCSGCSRHGDDSPTSSTELAGVCDDDTCADDVKKCIAARISQERYNYTLHAFFCIFPLLTYVIFRNLTLSLRSRASSFLAYWGQRSLELYLLQYHIWLAKDAKNILVVIPDAPLLNALVVFPAFLAASDIAHRSTSGIASFLLAHEFSLPGSETMWACAVAAAYVMLAVVMPR